MSLILSFFSCKKYLSLNLRKVLNEDVYISAQLPIKNLEKIIKKYRIKTVINLRGKNDGKDWYEKEKIFLEKNNIEFFDIKLSANEVPSRYQLNLFFDFYKKIKYPLLIHCREGNDRSYFLVYFLFKLNGKEIKKIYFFKKKIWDFFKEYKHFLKEKDLIENSKDLILFLSNYYCPQEYKYDLKIFNFPAKLKRGEIKGFKARVKNKSKKVWFLSKDLDKGIRIGAKIFGPFKELPKNIEKYFYENENKGIDVIRAGIQNDKIYPGQERTFEISFQAPKFCGFYFLAFDIVDEYKYWFYYYGKAPQFYKIEVY